MNQPLLDELLGALAAGEVELVDLTQPLSERTPVMRVPEPFVNTQGLRVREISRYDERGARWYWNHLELGEHVGTHLDAPVHWYTGRGREDVASVPLRRLVGPAVVIECAEQAAADPDYLLTLDELREFEKEHGALPEGGWLLMRTGWDARVHDPALFLNNASVRPRTPGIAADCARYLAQETGIVGVGVETVGTDAGASPAFDGGVTAQSRVPSATRNRCTGRLIHTGRLSTAAETVVSTYLGSAEGLAELTNSCCLLFAVLRTSAALECARLIVAETTAVLNGGPAANSSGGPPAGMSAGRTSPLTTTNFSWSISPTAALSLS